MADAPLVSTAEFLAKIEEIRKSFVEKAQADGLAYCQEHVESFAPGKTCWVCDALKIIQEAKRG